jgi:prepilin-type N-terminal cleavage/methylation domain-containing protein
MLERMRRLQSDEGFTLIELLIVIIILGILSAVVIFAVGSIGSNSAAAACQTDQSSVRTAAEAYYAQTGSYAANIGVLVPNYLHSAPGTSNYVLSITNAGVTVTVAAPTGGTQPAGCVTS